MQRLGLLARRFGFDVLIAVTAIESAIEARGRTMRSGGARLVANWLAVRALDGTAAVALTGPREA